MTLGASSSSRRWTHKPGEPVPTSGIYHIEHAEQHRQSHEVVLAKNDRFPACEVCEHEVRYSLVRAAPFVFEDPDFREREQAEDRALGQG